MDDNLHNIKKICYNRCPISLKLLIYKKAANNNSCLFILFYVAIVGAHTALNCEICMVNDYVGFKLPDFMSV